ncbi:MAG: DUF4837 family protein [Bacteroidales bacterium]|nr:DUF4837 family protein [Bacteroidales bacterium]
MRKLSFFLLMAAIILIGGSCKRTSSFGSVKSDNFSNGKAGEIILVLDSSKWTVAQIDELRNFFNQPQPAINQIEPMFDILTFSNRDFTAYFQRHRNIIRFDINPDYAANHFQIIENNWSSPQIYAYFKGNNADTCMALFRANDSLILQRFYENDLKRSQTYFARIQEESISKLIKAKFNIQLTVPNHYFVAADYEDFLWLRFRTEKNDRFIMIYRTPATELTQENLIAARNEMTQKYVPGAVKGAYPIVAEKLGFPIVKPLSKGNKEGMEMRGLWESVNDKMGGPFYSFTFPSTDGQYNITVDGFVYAPQEPKRDYLREVEAIVKTVR